MPLAPGEAAAVVAGEAARRRDAPAARAAVHAPPHASDGWRASGPLARTDATGTEIDVAAVPHRLLPAVLAHEGIHAAQLARGRTGAPAASRPALEDEARAATGTVLAGRTYAPELAAAPDEVLFWGPDDVCEPTSAPLVCEADSAPVPWTAAPSPTTLTEPSVLPPQTSVPAPVYGPALPPGWPPVEGGLEESDARTCEPDEVLASESDTLPGFADPVCVGPAEQAEAWAPPDVTTPPDFTGTPGDTAADRALVDEHARELRRLYSEKAAYVAAIASSGPHIEQDLAGFDTEVAQRVASMRTLGVRLPAAEVVRRALASESLTELHPRLRHEPTSGPYRQGADLRFVVEVEFVPRTDPVRVTWTGALEGGRGTFPMLDRGGARDTELVLDSTFWFRAVPFVLDGTKNLTVTAELRVGPDRVSPDPSVVLPIQPYSYDSDELLRMSVRGAVMTGPVSAKALAGSRLTFWLSQGPPGEQYLMQWSYLSLDRHDAFPGTPFARHHEASSEARVTFDEPGTYSVIARILPGVSSRWAMWPVDPGHAPPTAALRLEIGTLQQWGSTALEQLRTEDTARPALGELGARLAAEARESDLLAGRATSEDREHYEDQAAQRRAMARALEDRVGVPVATVEPFPATDDGFGSGVYATAVPASLVIANSDATPGGGIQPLTLYLTMQRTDAGFSAVLIDATTKDMSPYAGSGPTSRAAADAAIRRWTDRNPYPIGGLAVYRYVLPDGTILRGRFSTTTREKEAEKFVEDILTIGGYVVAVLLLLAPEATVTKALAIGLLGLGVGYGVHRISRNLELGIGAFDARNVLEAVGILGSALGIGGSALRSAGLRAARPLMYRAGNWMILSTVAVDAGTLTYVGVESYEMLRATLSDPSLSDDDRVALLARMAGQLLSQATMVVVGNRDLVRGGVRRSDFFSTRRPGLAGLPALDPVSGRPVVELDPGSRIDLQAELVRRGMTPDDVLHLTDTSLVSELGRVQQGAMRGPDVYPRTPAPLSDTQQVEVIGAARVAHTSPGVTVDKTSNPTTLVLTVDGLPVEVRVDFTAPPAGQGTHGARSGPGRVRLDYDTRVRRWVAQVDLDPHLTPDDAGLLLREELDEAGEIVRRLNARVSGPDPLRGASLRRAVEGEQRASLARPSVIAELETAHDVSAFRTLGRLFAEARRTGTIDAWARLDRMLVEMGINPLRPDSRVRAGIERALGAEADPLLAYVWDSAATGTAPTTPRFTRAPVRVPAESTHRPEVIDQVRAYTEALADLRADPGGTANAQLNAVEQLAAAAHHAPTLTVDALVREGMPRAAAQRLVTATGGANPYDRLYDVLLSSFDARRQMASTPEVMGRRFTVAQSDGTTRQPRAIEALNDGGPPDAITFSEFMRRMDATGVTPTVQRMGDADGAGWIQWSFTEPDGSSSRVRLDIPGASPSTGQAVGYHFESAENLHAGATFTPAGSSSSLPMSAGGVEVWATLQGAHIRIVPDAAMIPRLTALEVGPASGGRLSEILARRNL